MTGEYSNKKRSKDKSPIIKVLNLYAGIGGNRKSWPENVQVTAVETNDEIADTYKENFPNDKIIRLDAHQFLLDALKYMDFDFIWSSPPCQTHSLMNKGTRHDLMRYPDMNLYQEILMLANYFCGKWVVENVRPYYTPLVKPYKVDRHVFWSNFYIPDMKLSRPGLYAKKDELVKWIGLKYPKNIYIDGNHCECQVLRNCVHPNIGLHVFNSAFKYKQRTVLDHV